MAETSRISQLKLYKPVNSVSILQLNLCMSVPQAPVKRCLLSMNTDKQEGAVD